jgi:hypothetical protein
VLIPGKVNDLTQRAFDLEKQLKPESRIHQDQSLAGLAACAQELTKLSSRLPVEVLQEVEYDLKKATRAILMAAGH